MFTNRCFFSLAQYFHIISFIIIALGTIIIIIIIVIFLRLSLVAFFEIREVPPPPKKALFGKCPNVGGWFGLVPNFINHFLYCIFDRFLGKKIGKFSFKVPNL